MNIESSYTELALYGNKSECARTDNVFPPISEFCNGTVCLKNGGENLSKSVLPKTILLKIE